MTDPSFQKKAQSLQTACLELIGKLPSRASKGSQRAKDYEALRRTPSGGGWQRSELLDDLNSDAGLMYGRTAHLFGGVIDLLKASSVGEYSMNTSALTAIVRALAEVSGALRWLTEEGISADDRVCRYLVWRFHDLELQRKLVDQFAEYYPARDEPSAQELLNSAEAKLLNRSTRANFNVDASSKTRRYACVLNDDNKKVEFPKKNFLVDQLLGECAYILLSISAHSERSSVIRAIEAVIFDTETPEVELRGELPIGMLLSFATYAMIYPGISLASWNDVDARDIRGAAMLFLSSFGVTPSCLE